MLSSVFIGFVHSWDTKTTQLARKLLFSNPIYKSEIVFGSPMASFKWGDCKYTSSAHSSGMTTVQADKISTPDYEPWLEDGGPVLLQTCFHVRHGQIGHENLSQLGWRSLKCLYVGNSIYISQGE